MIQKKARILHREDASCWVLPLIKSWNSFIIDLYSPRRCRRDWPSKDTAGEWIYQLVARVVRVSYWVLKKFGDPIGDCIPTSTMVQNSGALEAFSSDDLASIISDYHLIIRVPSADRIVEKGHDPFRQVPLRRACGGWAHAFHHVIFVEDTPGKESLATISFIDTNRPTSVVLGSLRGAITANGDARRLYASVSIPLRTRRPNVPTCQRAAEC